MVFGTICVIITLYIKKKFQKNGKNLLLIEIKRGLYWLSFCKLHNIASPSLADTDFALVASSWVAELDICLPNFQFTF